MIIVNKLKVAPSIVTIGHHQHGRISVVVTECYAKTNTAPEWYNNGREIRFPFLTKIIGIMFCGIFIR